MGTTDSQLQPDHEDEGRFNNSAVWSRLSEDGAMKRAFPPWWTKVWTSIGVDRGTLLKTMKGVLPPTIAIAMYAVSALFSEKLTLFQVSE